MTLSGQSPLWPSLKSRMLATVFYYPQEKEKGNVHGVIEAWEAGVRVVRSYRYVSGIFRVSVVRTHIHRVLRHSATLSVQTSLL